MQCVWWEKNGVVVGVDVHVLWICTNKMERTYDCHPALINVLCTMYSYSKKWNESVCVCAWVIHTCIGICQAQSIIHDGVWG